MTTVFVSFELRSYILNSPTKVLLFFDIAKAILVECMKCKIACMKCYHTRYFILKCISKYRGFI